MLAARPPAPYLSTPHARVAALESQPTRVSVPAPLATSPPLAGAIAGCVPAPSEAFYGPAGMVPVSEAGFGTEPEIDAQERRVIPSAAGGPPPRQRNSP